VSSTHGGSPQPAHDEDCDRTSQESENRVIAPRGARLRAFRAQRGRGERRRLTGGVGASRAHSRSAAWASAAPAPADGLPTTRTRMRRSPRAGRFDADAERDVPPRTFVAGGARPCLPSLIQGQGILLGRGRARVRVDAGFKAEGGRDGGRTAAEGEHHQGSARGHGHAEGTHPD
jgi:hypothetical protein